MKQCTVIRPTIATARRHLGWRFWRGADPTILEFGGTMTPVHRNQTFLTRQVLEILQEAGLRLDHERLKVWHRRGFAPGKPVARGRERSYTLKDLIRIASLVFISRRVGQLGPHGAGLSAHSLANDFADVVYSVYQTGPDAGVAQRAPVYILTEKREAATTVLERITGDPSIRRVAEMYATGTATIVQAGYFAMHLAAAVDRVSDVADG